MEKTEGPTSVLTVLGVEIDAQKMELRLPRERLQQLLEMVGSWRKRKCCTKRQLQSLAGHLNHACKVVRPGRRFLRGIFSLLSGFSLKNHMIRLNAAFRADMEWWWCFASNWNGVSVISQGSDEVPDFEFCSDASGSWGGGAVWDNQWFQIEWARFPEFMNTAIAAKELLPVVVAVVVWGWKWTGRVVLCRCDNQAVVSVIRGGYCKDPAMAHMLRCLFFAEAMFSVRLVARHIPGRDNIAADSVSRNNLDRLFLSRPQAERNPVQVPEGVVKQLVSQQQWTSHTWKNWLASWWRSP